MSATGKLITPTEALTGQPYPVLFNNEYLSQSGSAHHTEHPKGRPELEFYKKDEEISFADIGIAAALRCSRVGWLPDTFHIDGMPNGYHSIYWGPWIEDDDTSKFITVGMNLSGVQSRTALDLSKFASKGRIKERRLTSRQHDFLTDPKLMHIEGNAAVVQERTKRIIGHSIINYALSQLSPSSIEAIQLRRFKDARRPSKMYRTARQIINFSVSRAIEEQIMPVYKEAQLEGMVPKRGWQNPRDAIFDMLPEHEYHLHHEQLRQALIPEVARAA